MSRRRDDAVAEAYAAFDGFSLDCFLDQLMRSLAEGPVLVCAQIQRLFANGLLRRA